MLVNQNSSFPLYLDNISEYNSILFCRVNISTLTPHHQWQAALDSAHPAYTRSICRFNQENIRGRLCSGNGPWPLMLGRWIRAHLQPLMLSRPAWKAEPLITVCGGHTLDDNTCRSAEHPPSSVEGTRCCYRDATSSCHTSVNIHQGRFVFQ